MIEQIFNQYGIVTALLVITIFLSFGIFHGQLKAKQFREAKKNAYEKLLIEQDGFSEVGETPATETEAPSEAAAKGIEAKIVSNWIMGDLFRTLNEAKIEREEIGHTKISAENFAKLIALVEKGTINAQTARKDVLPAMWETGKDAAQIVDERGLGQISDSSLIAAEVLAALEANPDMVRKYLAGNEKLVNALFGQAMARLKGKGDAQVIRQILQEKLEAMKS